MLILTVGLKFLAVSVQRNGNAACLFLERFLTTVKLFDEACRYADFVP